MSTLPKVGGSSVNTLVAIGVTLTTAILLFLLSTSYTSLVARLERLEIQNVAQQEILSAVHVQLDTIDRRGSSGADTRITALETRLQNDETRIARLETAQTRSNGLTSVDLVPSGRGGGNDRTAEQYTCAGGTWLADQNSDRRNARCYMPTFALRNVRTSFETRKAPNL